MTKTNTMQQLLFFKFRSVSVRCSSRLSRLGKIVSLVAVAVAAHRHAAAAAMPNPEQEVPDVVEVIGR